MANVMDCDIAVSKFELQLYYYVHFRIYNLGKGVNSFVKHANYLPWYSWEERALFNDRK